VRQRPAKPCTRVRFPSPPRAISSAGERFPDTEEVTGSIPVSRTRFDQHVGRAGSPKQRAYADVAQLVAHHLAKVRVAGSNPVIRSTPAITMPARLAQRESASLTRKRSLVQSQYRAQKMKAPFEFRRGPSFVRRAGRSSGSPGEDPAAGSPVRRYSPAPDRRVTRRAC
jgi:hypothetical protein